MSALSPTVVLVQGAFAESSSWNGVIVTGERSPPWRQETEATDR
jgi:hypothetical protein